MSNAPPQHPPQHYIAYFDSSGRAEDHDGVVVAGCVSSAEQWRLLAPDWNRILEEEGVEASGGYRALHMKDLGHSRRAFRGWTPARSKRLLERLASLIRVRVRFLFGIGVSANAYRDSQLVLTKNAGCAPNPLTFCAASCVQEIGGWLIRNKLCDSRVTYVFEDGDPNKGEVERMMTDIANTPRKSADYCFAGLGYGGKHIAGLQIADWVSYETFLWGNREILPLYGEGKPSTRPTRRSLSALLRVPNKLAYFRGVEGILRETQERLAVFERDHGAIPWERLAAKGK
jgi:hypothetical protein